MQFLYEYGLFLAKAVTVVAAILFVVGGIARASGRGRGSREPGQLTVTNLNRRYRRLRDTMRRALGPPLSRRALRKERKAARAAEAGERDRDGRKRVFVLTFEGDVKASQVESLRREVTAVLSTARPGDEVMLRLFSLGGLVHAYGLAASQLVRLRERQVPVTAVVDKVAASGGYMMAAVADRIVAAPFAVIGSIGVVATVPNVHRLLKRHEVDVEQLTAGEHKRTLTVFGENTDKGRAKFQQDLDETHALFKDWVGRYRPELDVARVATGEHWYGAQALSLGLVDELATSDDWLVARFDEADVFHVRYRIRKSVSQRFTEALERMGVRLFGRAMAELDERKLG